MEKLLLFIYFETSAMFDTVYGNNVAPATLQLFYQCALSSLETRKIVTFVIHKSYFRMHNLEQKGDGKIPFSSETSVSLLSCAVD